MAALNNLLRRERERLGWSQMQVAEKIGVDAKTIARWELGVTSPLLSYQRKLSELFGKTPQELGLLPTLQTEKEDKPLTRAEVERLLHEAGSPDKLNLSGRNLEGTNLAGLDLREANLHGANLNDADIHTANLSGADLRYAELSGADLREAKLHEATLKGADLNRLDLRDAKLYKAALRDADLRDANLSRADLRDADLSRANLSRADLRDADLSRANLSGATLSGATLRGAKLHEVKLHEAKLCEADLREADLSGADLLLADLLLADLKGANLSRADLSRAYLIADLRYVNLSGANLSRAILFRANLSHANLSKADLKGANLSGASLYVTDLRGADLRGADLREADLGRADLGRATITRDQWEDLRRARFRDINLENVIVGEPYIFERISSKQASEVREQTSVRKDKSLIRIRITEEPLTAHNLAMTISVLTELYTKCWLISHERFAELIEYTQTRNVHFAEEAGLVITKVRHHSPVEVTLGNLDPEKLAKAIGQAIDGVTQAKLRHKKLELENQEKAEQIREAERRAEQEYQAKQQELAIAAQKAAQESQTAQLEQEKQKLELEKQRLTFQVELEKQKLELERQQVTLEKERLEVFNMRMSYLIEIAGKMVDMLQPNADPSTRAMLIQDILPNLLQLQNGKGLELVALSAPQKGEENTPKAKQGEAGP